MRQMVFLPFFKDFHHINATAQVIIEDSFSEFNYIHGMENDALECRIKEKRTLYILGYDIFIFLGLGCFSFSLLLPSFYTSTEHIYGYWILITGWLGLVFFQFAWFSNPLNLLALLLAAKKPKTAFIISFSSLLLVSLAFWFYEIPIGLDYEKVFIKEFGPGFYLWVLSHILIFIALFIRFFDSLTSQC